LDEPHFIFSVSKFWLSAFYCAVGFLHDGAMASSTSYPEHGSRRLRGRVMAVLFDDVRGMAPLALFPVARQPLGAPLTVLSVNCACPRLVFDTASKIRAKAN